MNTINVAAYCRVSTDEADQLHSLSAQIKYFTDYINQHEDWKLKEVYFDEGITGTSVKKRVSFNRMIADAENGEVGLILTKEVSRFARNTIDTLSYTRRLSALNVGVVFMNDGIDTRDKDGELRLTIMASIAQEESRKTSERVKWGLKRKMENGFVFGNGSLLGFRIDKGVLSIIPEEAEIVKRIFNEYLYNKKGSHTIARELNADGILTVNSKPWKSDAVLRILKNEKYAGDLTQLKSYVPDYLTKAQIRNKGEIPLICIENHHEGFISREVWDAVQVQISERVRTREGGGRFSAAYWFSGKTYCGKCGKSYVAVGGKIKKSGSIKCFNRQCNGTEKHMVGDYEVGCNNDTINQTVLAECMRYLLEHVKVAKESIVEDLLTEIANMQKCEKANPVNTKSLETEIENLDRKKRESIDLMLEGIITKSDLKKQTEFYDSEVVRLMEEINNAKNSDGVFKKQIAEIKALIAEVNRAAEVDSCNTELYRELTEKVIINHDKTVDCYLNCVPFGFRIAYTAQHFGRRGLEYEILSLAAIE
jgi:DNA invertase Pin-like site-specific DNA recombinase